MHVKLSAMHESPHALDMAVKHVAQQESDGRIGAVEGAKLGVPVGKPLGGREVGVCEGNSEGAAVVGDTSVVGLWVPGV